ncbi:MAG: bifunctional diaminohydroxyphosphoribosylaminopyrimidine deaminase/5-amino-6-(5-phosphoribosylamino)uracil reductase RibD [Bacteroidota bacterium]|nr:bifunctional diaminohydroxyphosphoribosylaminopyrimidine deaminase/5-amino-6-(5-phosphoribosylamino)uracil reductase RibD [Bacteroidota bacterium]MDP4218144.1 bifunctional diaminohydroxyphosphoribosylaminopyrimidine deaminase/5-amino-6-(5-phosphoribosylamino)uracil reductase RibD [Bacteroidota bacterium]MDP4252937.1 bifunctional diaminohydroxyphosphoribosylaminopyrimidine deaminase/5-amino-6-(5-phosphoribosylamino)uracil reductase RibD [Bacteroidota bacterium]MDP4256964.1 bifunctional diamino
MFRCLELAGLAAGHVAPNPMVGALLVHEDRIIGEGFHRQYGQAHAEVNCLASVRPENRPFIPASTLYVSLEPCAHFGKTPPCADLIIRERIPRVVIGARDPFPGVDGKGMEKLRAAGVDVHAGVLERECRELNRRFFVFHTHHRPYIALKWAQTANGKLAGGGTNRLLISNDYSNRLVHKWRTEEAAILIGTNTALLDDPSLTARLWTGPDPIRLVVDADLRLPRTLQLFDGKARTIIFNRLRHEMTGNPGYFQLAGDSSLVHQLSMALYQLNILSVLVEGGATLLQSFIDEGYWDEARIITNEELLVPEGLPAPVLSEAQAVSHEQLLSDRIAIYKNPNPPR